MKKHMFTFLLLVGAGGILLAQNPGVVVYGEPTELEYHFEPISAKNDPGMVLLSEQHATSFVYASPSLPFDDPGYTANGSFTVTVVNGTCVGTYSVTASPIAGSGPGGSTPPFTTITGYFGFGQGNFLFNNAGYGSYTVSVNNTNGACNPDVNPVVFQVDIPEPVPVPISQWSILAAFALILGYSVFAFRRYF
jgi:hypothetical protein